MLEAYEKSYGKTPYSRPWGVHIKTLDVLARRGLVETRERPMSTVARLTDEGRAMLALMRQ